MDNMVTANGLHYEEFAYLKESSCLCDFICHLFTQLSWLSSTIGNKIICQTVISKDWRQFNHVQVQLHPKPKLAICANSRFDNKKGRQCTSIGFRGRSS